MTQLDFRRALLQQLDAAYPLPSTHAHAPPPTPLTSTAHGHWPLFTRVARKCAQCPKGRGQGRRRKCVCERCGVHLCPSPCFKLHHVVQEQGS